MPISSNTRKAGPFTGTGLVTTYPFNFKVFQAADVYVVRANMTGTESVLVLNTDYTVSLNADQDVSPGGNVVLSSALTSGYTLVITSSIENLQPTDLTNGGGFYPSVITDALDRACIQIQQLQEVSDRSLKIDITSSTTPANYLTEVKAARDAAQSAQSAAEIAQAAAEAALDSFDGRYLGAKATDPILDNDGNALVAGALYFNTTSNIMRAYTGSVWQDNNAVSDGSITPAKLARVGTAGQVLTSGGAGADPSYQTISTTQIQTVTASVASNALTIGSGALSLAFRSTTLGDGTVTTVTGTPTAIVVPSGATLGTVSAVQNQLVVIAMNNAGTIELAVVNLAGGNNLDETTLISTTALSAASDSANVVYSTTARTNLPFRVVGLVQSTQATAGTWATAPSLVQGTGGQALTAMSSLGYGQTWQNVTGSRAVSITYYNTTGKPIVISLQAVSNAGASAGQAVALTVNGISVPGVQTAGSLAGYGSYVNAVIPSGASYSCPSTTFNIAAWLELR